MSRVEALQALLEKVEAGEWSDQTRCLRSPPKSFTALLDFPAVDGRGRQAWGAYHGSLDAAKALHEALLPGWRYAVDGGANGADAEVHTEPVQKLIPGGSMCSVIESVHSACINEPMPARAWLIAILKALIAQEQEQ